MKTKKVLSPTMKPLPSATLCYFVTNYTQKSQNTTIPQSICPFSPKSVSQQIMKHKKPECPVQSSLKKEYFAKN